MLLDRLRTQTRLSREKLERFAETASLRYKSYYIPKRNGGRRLIEHPSKEIKSIQRWLNSTLINKLPIHDCATAYREGQGIRENAARHAASNFTLRVDFKDFFPSFFESDVELFLNARVKQIFPLDSEDISFFKRIVCRNGKLTIGAPSSPQLTNAMMGEFDYKMASFCQEKSLVYTRYADDIFVSTNNPRLLDNALIKIREYASQHQFARLTINEEKTAFLSRKFRRSVTGLIITPQGGVSIGLDRKKYIKSQIYKYKNGTIDVDRIA